MSNITYKGILESEICKRIEDIIKNSKLLSKKRIFRFIFLFGQLFLFAFNYHRLIFNYRYGIGKTRFRRNYFGLSAIFTKHLFNQKICHLSRG